MCVCVCVNPIKCKICIIIIIINILYKILHFLTKFIISTFFVTNKNHIAVTLLISTQITPSVPLKVFITRAK